MRSVHREEWWPGHIWDPSDTVTHSLSYLSDERRRDVVVKHGDISIATQLLKKKKKASFLFHLLHAPTATSLQRHKITWRQSSIRKWQGPLQGPGRGASTVRYGNKNRSGMGRRGEKLEEDE